MKPDVVLETVVEVPKVFTTKIQFKMCNLNNFSMGFSGDQSTTRPVSIGGLLHNPLKGHGNFHFEKT